MKRPGPAAIEVTPQASAPAWSERAFAVGLTASFLALGLLGAMHHELWRDELHSWLLARDSSNLWDVFQVTRHEAHFVLWRVILYGLTRVTHNPVALQLFNLLLATGTVWIIAAFSPFSRLEKCLLSFGYYFSFEYCIIAQDYTLIVILMFAFCALYPRRTGSYLGLSVVLWLLANSLPYGLLIAFVFAALLVFDWFFNPETRDSRKFSTSLRISLLIVATGFACGILQLLLMKSGPNTDWRHPLALGDLAKTVINIWRAYVPVPGGFPHPHVWTWGSNFIDEIPEKHGVILGLSLLLVLVAVGLLLKRPGALFLYVFGTAALLCAQFIVNLGALRHTAFLFMMLVAALWVGGDSEKWRSSGGSIQRLGDFFGRWRASFVPGLLVIHVVVAAYAYSMDWISLFSGSKSAARFIQERGLSTSVIVGIPEVRVAALSGYLDRPIYYPESSRWGSYFDHDRTRKEISQEQLLKTTLEFARETHHDVVLATVSRALTHIENGETTPFTSARINANGEIITSSATDSRPVATLTRVAVFVSIVDEPYGIYILRPDNL